MKKRLSNFLMEMVGSILVIAPIGMLGVLGCETSASEINFSARVTEMRISPENIESLPRTCTIITFADNQRLRFDLSQSPTCSLVHTGDLLPVIRKTPALSEQNEYYWMNTEPIRGKVF